MAGGEERAAFVALAHDAEDSLPKAAEQASKFADETADKVDSTVAAHVANDEQIGNSFAKDLPTAPGDATAPSSADQPVPTQLGDTTPNVDDPNLPFPRLVILDNEPGTQEIVDQLGLVPSDVFQKVERHLYELPTGGITVGKTPISDMPGGIKLAGTPPGYPPNQTWADVAGMYRQDTRRLVINSGMKHRSGSLALHEFGHAVDDAYGGVSGHADFLDLHKQVLQTVEDNHIPMTVGKNANEFHPYFKSPVEFWAEGFGAYTRGDETTLMKLSGSSPEMEAKLKDYYHGILGY